MNFFQEFRTETKLLLVVVLAAVVLAVGGIWLLRAMNPPAPERTLEPEQTQETAIDWTGVYEYSEFAEGIGSNMTWGYDLSIYEEEGQLMADLEISGWQTHIQEKAIAEQEGDLLNIISKESLYDRYEGELLFSLRKISENKLGIVWGRLQSNLSDPPDPYFTRVIEWQTYRNREYGFEFLRPDMGSIQVSTTRWQASFAESAAKIPWERDSKEVMVAGAPAVQGVKYYGGESGAWHLVTFIDLTPKTVISLSTWTTREDDEKHKENLQQHEQILSTFRFIDPNDLSFLKDSFSAWGTYEGRLDLEIPRDYTKRDFKFNYPLNWVVNEFGLRRGLYIATFADAYIPTSGGSASASGLPEISPQQGTAVISVQPGAQAKNYSFDRWVDSVFKSQVRIFRASEETFAQFDRIIVERGITSPTQNKNILITYKVPDAGIEGKEVYVVSEQEWGENATVVYEFRLLYNQADSTENKNIYEDVFNQILSSFQTIEQ